MHTLPSGLPSLVADAEDLSRFLTQSSQFNAAGPKPAAFLPNPNYRNSSVFRFGNDPALLHRTWAETAAAGRMLKGAAFLKAGVVRDCGLEVGAEEPPAAHANIEGWPWIDSDLELQKSQQLEKAALLASESEMIRL